MAASPSFATRRSTALINALKCTALASDCASRLAASTAACGATPRNSSSQAPARRISSVGPALCGGGDLGTNPRMSASNWPKRRRLVVAIARAKPASRGGRFASASASHAAISRGRFRRSTSERIATAALRAAYPGADSDWFCVLAGTLITRASGRLEDGSSLSFAPRTGLWLLAHFRGHLLQPGDALLHGGMGREQAPDSPAVKWVDDEHMGRGGMRLGIGILDALCARGNPLQGGSEPK